MFVTLNQLSHELLTLVNSRKADGGKPIRFGRPFAVVLESCGDVIGLFEIDERLGLQNLHLLASRVETSGSEYHYGDNMLLTCLQMIILLHKDGLDAKDVVVKRAVMDEEQRLAGNYGRYLIVED